MVACERRLDAMGTGYRPRSNPVANGTETAWRDRHLYTAKIERTVMEHVQAKCTNPDCGGTCPACTLAVCDVCGLFEGAQTTECPCVAVSGEQVQQVYEGKIDFRNGKWVKAVSIHSPEFIGIDKDYIDKVLEENGLGVVGEDDSVLARRIRYAFRQVYRDAYTDALKNYAVYKNGELQTAMGRNVNELIKGLEKETVPVRYY